MNFRQLETEFQGAADLLRLSAFLSPDKIPLELLAAGAPELGSLLSAALADVREDPVVLDETMAPLMQFSLIYRQIETRSYSVHRLVQAVVRAELDHETRRLWAERAVRAVNLAFPDVEFSTWALCERLLSQAHACAELIDQWRLEFPEGPRLLNKAGRYLYERARYAEAEPFYRQALQIEEPSLGPKNPELAKRLSALAELRAVKDHFDEAESLYQRVLSIQEEAGSELELAASLNRLAWLYRVQERYREAEPLYRRALDMQKKMLGPEHPEPAKNLHGLAELYRVRELYDEAEPLYRQALAIWEKTVGLNHRYVARCLTNLAELYRAQGRYAEAEPLYQRALAIREKTLGPEHPNVATCLENYAFLLREMGRSEEAVPLESRARAIRAKRE
jgi:tetratricopeptide (TPR) repeat protein